jgi:four helix bundle protein
MATYESFEELQAWQKARELVNKIYSVSKHGMFARDFPLRDQIRKAGVSIISNIAEGFDRGGTAEFVQFLSFAKGSAGEVRSQLYVAKDQGYLTSEDFDRLMELADETSRLIGGLMIYLRKSGIKGTKFKAL